MTIKALVQCVLEVPVEYPDDSEEWMMFDIVENSCPGTHTVGSAIDSIREKCDEKSYCWACKLRGENKFIKYLSDEEYKQRSEIKE